MCPYCGSNKLRENWHKTEIFYIYNIEDGQPVRTAEIVDLCPGNGITTSCGQCGEVLFSGSVMAYARTQHSTNQLSNNT